MPKAKKTPTTPPAAPIALPTMPPPTQLEADANGSIIASLRRAVAALHRRNIESAILLCDMARRGQLSKDLEDHIAELGRRFAHVSEAWTAEGVSPPMPRPRLAVDNTQVPT